MDTPQQPPALVHIYDRRVYSRGQWLRIPGWVKRSLPWRMLFGGVWVERRGLLNVPVRVYEPIGRKPEWTLVWAHGGSFVPGDLNWPEADWVARRVAERGIRVMSVDYSLASKKIKAPGPALDVATVLREAWATHHGKIAGGGASAGAHLATMAAVMRPTVADRLLLLYPTLHREQREDAGVAALTESLPETKRFSAKRIRDMVDFYHGAQFGPSGDLRIPGELEASVLAELPETVIVTAECDDLRVSGEMFAEQLSEAGVPVTMRMREGALHGFMNQPEVSAEARAHALATIDAFVAVMR